MEHLDTLYKLLAVIGMFVGFIWTVSSLVNRTIIELKGIKQAVEHVDAALKTYTSTADRRFNELENGLREVRSRIQ
jgi:hypothetical protein